MNRSSPPDDYRASPDSDERVEIKDSAAKYEQERIQVLQQERVHVQKKTFTKWCNSFLEKVCLGVTLVLSVQSVCHAFIVFSQSYCYACSVGQNPFRQFSRYQVCNKLLLQKSAVCQLVVFQIPLQ